VRNAREVQKDLRLSFVDQAANRSVQRQSAAANSDAAFQVENSYISLAAFMNIKIDHLSLLRTSNVALRHSSHALD
jgi:formylmethanofuran dehydrogenase subunit E-like metal-binding protein